MLSGSVTSPVAHKRAFLLSKVPSTTLEPTNWEIPERQRETRCAGLHGHHIGACSGAVLTLPASAACEHLYCALISERVRQVSPACQALCYLYGQDLAGAFAERDLERTKWVRDLMRA